jgi:integrase
MVHQRYAHLGAWAKGRMLTFVGRMFSDAIIYGWCDHQGRIVWKATANPATAVARPKVKQKLRLTLTDEQAGALLRQMEKNHGTHHAFTICLAFEVALGLRSGEIANLRWSQVTLDDSVYPGAAGAVQWDGGQRKAGVVMRVPLPNELVRFLPPRGRPEQRVCGMSPNTVRSAMPQAMRRAAEQVGVPYEGLSPHTLRRSFATSLYKDGKTVGQIARALGHTRESTTYTYLQLENRAMNVVELALPRATKILGGGP